MLKKKLFGLFLSAVLVVSMCVISVPTYSAASYRDNFINAILDNEYYWYDNWGATVGISSGMTFTDLNFDGKPEFIMQYGGGSMLNCEADAYYYSNGDIYRAQSDGKGGQFAFQNLLKIYYDKSSNKYRMFGTAYMKDGVNYNWVGNFELNFNGQKITTNYYSSRIFNDPNYTGKGTYTYYNGAKSYGNVSGYSKISKSQYDTINSNKLKNCVDANMKTKLILAEDWEYYSYSQKKKALQEAYDAFSYGVSPTSVKVNRSTLTLGVGESYGILKTVSPSNAKTSYTWSSSNSSVASVNSSGKVTAKKAGTANITVKTSNGKTATCKVTVKPAPTSVKISNLGLTLGKGETFIVSQSTNSGSYAWGFSWSSSNTSVATVAKTTANKAKITAKGTGTATITIKTYNGKTATCKVTVKPAPTSVKTNPTSITLGVGESYTISESTNSGTYANASNLKWSSTNTNVATVTKGSANKATITAKGVGTAYVKITLYNGKTAQCKVTVKPAPTSVKLNKTSITLDKGQTYTISESTNSGTYANSANLKWSSTNTSVATVTKGSANKATITAKEEGTSEIKITLYNGKTATCKVTVK